MKSFPVQSSLSAQFLSSRGVIADSAQADHFAQLLVGMKTLSAKEVPTQSVTKMSGNREHFEYELIEDIYGLDQIMEGMNVASKLNANALQSSKDEMTPVSESLLRLQVDGTTYFMQTNYVNQRLGELDEHMKAVIRSR